MGQVYDIQVPYVRVRYPNEDWKELSRREMTSGIWRCRNTQGKEAEAPRRERAQGGKARPAAGRKVRLSPGTPALGRR